MNNLVSQSEFARLKAVSRKTVSEWNSKKLLVFVGKLVDVDATQRRMQASSSYRAKGQLRPVTSPAPEVQPVTPRYADGAAYGNPANLPDDVVATSSMIASGAGEMARLVRPHLALPVVKALVTAWVEAMRVGIVGGTGLPTSVADMDWPKPPIGLDHWCEHPLFLGDPSPACEWAEIEEDLATGKLAKVG